MTSAAAPIFGYGLAVAFGELHPSSQLSLSARDCERRCVLLWGVAVGRQAAGGG
jgi:hypothetical protein